MFKMEDMGTDSSADPRYNVLVNKILIVLSLNLVFKARLNISPKLEPGIRTLSDTQMKKQYLFLCSGRRFWC